MKRKVLVTGSTGFVGKNLIPQLKLARYEVVEINSQHGDIVSIDLSRFKVDHVIHLAAKTYVPDSWENPQEFYRVNVLGTENILEYCRRESCPITYLSTYVYGNPLTLPISEEHPINPNSPYNHSKYLAESICKFYADRYDLCATVLRPFNIYGPGQSANFLIPSIIAQIMDDTKTSIEVMDLTPKRDYLYITDLANAIIETIGSTKFEVYNVGSGESFSVEDLINMIFELTGKTKDVFSKKIQRSSEVMDLIADTSRIKVNTGWKARESMYEGLKKTIELHKNK